MAEKNKGDDELNLELPSLSLRRKRKEKTPAPETTGAVEPDSSEPGTEPTVVLPTASSDAKRFAPKETPEAPPAPIKPAEASEPAAEDAPVPEKPAGPTKVKAEKAPKPEKPARELTLPNVPAMQASVITGVLVGILACGATWLGLQGCQAIKGTSSCGGPGFLLLLGILIVLVVVGGYLLKAFRVTDAGSTSFLAVGLMSVVVLLFLVDVIFDWWMIIVIPLVAAATFALSHWVTVKFIEAGDV